MSGIGDGVQQQVAVGVARQALGMVDLQATDHQRHTGLEGVGVETEADTHAHSEQ
jgi:hypothetical protein